MNPKYCVSLELAKQIAEAGWTKETEFWWVKHKRISEPDYQNCVVLGNNSPLFPKEHWNYFSAPLSDEILEELPPWTTGGLTIHRWCHINEYEVGYQSMGQWTVGFERSRNKTLANALAKLWLFLKKEKLI